METNSSLTKICYGVTIVWIESSLTSGPEHSSAHSNLLNPVRGVAVLLRYASEEALETTELQAPDPLSYNGSFGAERTRKNNACMEIYYLLRSVWNTSEPADRAHFLQQMSF